MILGQLVEDDGRDRERLVADLLERRMQRQEPVLTVDGAQDSFTFRNPQRADGGPVAQGLEAKALVARDDDRAGDRGQVARLATLLVILDELIDLAADDVPLVGLVARGDAPFEQVPVDFRPGAPATAAHRRVRLVGVAQDLEAHELVDVLGGQ